MEKELPVEQRQNSDTGLVVRKEQLPAKIPVKRPQRRGWTGFFITILVIIAGAVATIYWWTHRPPPLPPGFAYGNGRLEADQIDIQTKFPGRILKLLADEGDMVKGGQVLAIMDTSDLQAQLNSANAQIRQASKAIDEAKNNVTQLQTQEKLAQQEFTRTQNLVKQGWATRELFDQRTQQLNAAQAALRAGEDRLLVARHAFEAATHNAELLKVNIADNTLVAPRAGRIQYRLANTGEVLAAGGKVFTMLDINYVYMDIYLPTADAGKIKVGSEGRILLDAYPDRPIPAYVSFVATQSQFNPKAVETQSEREKLLFRVRVRVDQDVLKAHAEAVHSGLPGLAYVRVNPRARWPARLQLNLVR
jgi:HlyD family secretion protein